MEMTGERIIAADRETVWRALNDADVLKECIPGCERMEKTSPYALEADVTQKVGPVKAKFKGSVVLEDVVEAVSYRIVGEGKGGAAGFAKGGARVRLEDAEGGTKLSYDAEAKVGGKLAQLGSRLIDGFAKKMADEFFDRFKARVEGPAEQAPVAPPAYGDAAGNTPAGAGVATAPVAADAAVAAMDAGAPAETAAPAPAREEAPASRREEAPASRRDDAPSGAAAEPAQDGEKKKGWLGRLFG
jgi:hypothetical protein